jgi:hypothetical protein
MEQREMHRMKGKGSSPGSVLAFSVAAVLAAFTAGPAKAIDGVQEINQACATGTGCFPGDGGGFPVTITAQGSYRLTGSLDGTGVGDNTNLIEILAAHVTLDLNGFEVVHAQSCDDPPTLCTRFGSGRGIDGSVSSNVTVRDGTFRNAIEFGVFLGPRARVSGVRVSGCGGSGILVGDNSQVLGSTSTANGVDGIQLFAGSLARGNTVTRNAGIGILSFGSGQLIGNIARGNAFGGLDLADTDGYALNRMGENASVTTGSTNQVFGGVNLGQNLCNDVLCPP